MSDKDANIPADPDAPLHGTAAASEVDDVQDDVVEGSAPPPGDGEFPEDAEGRADDAELGDSEDPVVSLERERDEYLDALRRKQAEFENFRKRMYREGASQRIAGHAEVAERMLDVLDDFDRTIDNAGDIDPGFLKGVQLVHDKLRGVLDDFGLTRIDEPGVDFDPNRHEAVQQVDAEAERDDPVVNKVLRPGYELGGRVLRAAMVVVEQ